ncbi:restriction endonuclease subunit S [Escherichia coli]|uniref:restriction endonuclease subunit S n=1 Tax=Escherichia coli TaxID=562 RepID=UPI0019315F6A|nr:restriction endonuclease subunit S [Escherichia coli]EJE3019281.1 restriction endonuclease subunit S [Escherichia coli]EJE7652142.1 restriction endonuclease subunit S [Escherichia coli]MBL7531328.1 restriction endonuclease subunit S [Escherichia coli]MDZ7221793.1 restriction endonuclease subunit S [Escherichia coli]HAW2853952.1 restriction endonuclease subunit S [Escherichia coli]
MSAGKLPEGWVETQLENIVDILDSMRVPVNNSERQSRIAGKKENELYPYFGATGEVGKIDDYIFDEELVALGEDGVPFFDGHKNKAYMLYGKTWVNNHAHVIRAISGLSHNKYLCHYLNQFDYHDYVNGGTRLKLTQANMRKLPVSLAPLAEQKIIAEKLDTLLAQVDSTKARLEQIPQILKRFRQAVLAAAVTGRLTKEDKDFITKKVELDNYKILIPEDWSETILNNIINTQRPLCYGVVQPGDNIKDGIELIRVCDINDGEVDLNHLRKISKEIDLQYKRSKVRKNDILVTIVGAIGRIGIVREDINVNIARAVARISPEYKIIVPMFLHIWLSSPVMQTWLVQSSKEVARKTLNLKDLKNAFVPLPSIEEQREIVRRVEQLFAYADTIEKQVNNALARVNNLTQSILAKAFRGELTVQWRAENPDLISGENSAAALLEKIKAERAASGGKKASRKKS